MSVEDKRGSFAVRRGQLWVRPSKKSHFIYCFFAFSLYNMNVINNTGVQTGEQQRYRRLTEYRRMIGRGDESPPVCRAVFE